MQNKTMAKQLQARSNNTQEVKEILNGQGFQANRPRYTSKPDIQKTEVHHQALYPENGAAQDVLYGKK